jgi:hypothetical protein
MKICPAQDDKDAAASPGVMKERIEMAGIVAAIEAHKKEYGTRRPFRFLGLRCSTAPN